jgi:hypothetical protein
VSPLLGRFEFGFKTRELSGGVLVGLSAEARGERWKAEPRSFEALGIRGDLPGYLLRCTFGALTQPLHQGKLLGGRQSVGEEEPQEAFVAEPDRRFLGGTKPVEQRRLALRTQPVGEAGTGTVGVLAPPEKPGGFETGEHRVDLRQGGGRYIEGGSPCQHPGGPQLDQPFLEDWGERFAAAWNSHDPDAVVALCTDDVLWSDPGVPPASPPMRIDGIDRWTFRDDLLCRYDTYYDHVWALPICAIIGSARLGATAFADFPKFCKWPASAGHLLLVSV